MVFFSVNLRRGTWGHVGATSRLGSSARSVIRRARATFNNNWTWNGLKLIFSSFKRSFEFCRSQTWSYSLTLVLCIVWCTHTHTHPQTLPDLYPVVPGRTTVEEEQERIPQNDPNRTCQQVVGCPELILGDWLLRYSYPGYPATPFDTYPVISFIIILEIDGIWTPHFFHIYIINHWMSFHDFPKNLGLPWSMTCHRGWSCQHLQSHPRVCHRGVLCSATAVAGAPWRDEFSVIWMLKIC